MVSKEETIIKKERDWPGFIHGIKPLCRWTDPEQKNRVYLLQRSDGLYTENCEVYSDDPFEMCWITAGSGFSLYDSKAIAIKEMEGKFPWMRGVLFVDLAPFDRKAGE